MESDEIGGRYSVIERIGKGAMGVVYKAYDPVLDRVVAIKKMASEIGQDEELRQRFYVEARAAARLNHRHIVTIHELEEADGEIYIVMELLEGVDLASVIRRRVQLPLEAKLSIVGQLCEGLDYAHRHGIVHRDIKPGNVHLSPTGLVKILDFGIARLASSKMTGTGALLGTPDYMSPEQVMGEDIDARSDLFAVGGVLYELIASAKPFESDSVASLLIKIARSPHVPITDRAPDTPVPLVSLVNRLLAKERDLRPPTAAAIAAELRAFVQSSSGGPETAAAAIIGGIVTEQTMALGSAPAGQPGPGTPRPGTPRPGTPRPAASSSPPRDTARTAAAASAPAPQGSAGSTSNARLASLALQRGRELRKAGDLAGAIEVFRSVLEVAPGNPEALEELQALETDIRQATAKATAAPVRDAAATVLRPRLADATKAAAAHADTVAPVPAAAPASGRTWGAPFAVAAALFIAAAAGGAYYVFLAAPGSTGPDAAVNALPSPAATPPQPPPPSAAASQGPPAPSAPNEAGPASGTPSSVPPAAAVVENKPETPAPSAVPASPANEPSRPAVDLERGKAEAARDRLADLKRARMASNPQAVPVRLRNEAIRLERQGTDAFARGEYARAATLYEEAGRLVALRERPGRMGGPEAPAASAPAPSRGTPAASEPAAPPRPFEPRRGASPPPDRADDPPPMRLPPAAREGASPGDISTFNRPAPATVDQMFNASPSARASIARITMLIEQYAKAMEQRDAQTLASIRTPLSPLEQRIVRLGKQVTYKLEDLNVQSNGSDGVATARRTVSAELENGEKLNETKPVTIRLTRRPNGWVITEIR